MAAAVARSGVSGGGGGDSAARLRLMCSNGGRFVPCGPDGGLRYVGGETRLLVVPREVPFRELAARLREMAGAAGLAAVRYRLVDKGLDDVLVSVTCDDELAHMRDEYDCLRATRPSASFRVFISTAAGAVQRGAGAGLPPLAPTIRRVQSEQAFPARAHLHPHAAGPAPMRRVHSEHQLAGAAACSLSSTTGATSAAATAAATSARPCRSQRGRCTHCPSCPRTPMVYVREAKNLLLRCLRRRRQAERSSLRRRGRRRDVETPRWRCRRGELSGSSSDVRV